MEMSSAQPEPMDVDLYEDASAVLDVADRAAGEFSSSQLPLRALCPTALCANLSTNLTGSLLVQIFAHRPISSLKVGARTRLRMVIRMI